MSHCESPTRPEDHEVVWIDDTGEFPAPQDTLLSISNVAKMFDISPLTLRFYERLGLIKRRHRVGRTRVYGWADCDRIAFIIKGRRVGLALGEIAPLLKAADTDASIESVKAGRSQCMELIDRLDRRRSHLREALAELRHLHTLLSTKSQGNGDKSA
jgi:DNA-binding transcriptional MerR regulator